MSQQRCFTRLSGGTAFSRAVNAPATTDSCEPATEARHAVCIAELVATWRPRDSACTRPLTSNGRAHASRLCTRARPFTLLANLNAIVSALYLLRCTLA